MTLKFVTPSVRALMVKHGIVQSGAVQKYVDNAVLRYSEPYIPKDTGTLARSGTIHTVIGSAVCGTKRPMQKPSTMKIRGGAGTERLREVCGGGCGLSE